MFLRFRGKKEPALKTTYSHSEQALSIDPVLNTLNAFMDSKTRANLLSTLRSTHAHLHKIPATLFQANEKKLTQLITRKKELDASARSLAQLPESKPLAAHFSYNVRQKISDVQSLNNIDWIRRARNGAAIAVNCKLVHAGYCHPLTIPCIVLVIVAADASYQHLQIQYLNKALELHYLGARLDPEIESLKKTMATPTMTRE